MPHPASVTNLTPLGPERVKVACLGRGRPTLQVWWWWPCPMVLPRARSRPVRVGSALRGPCATVRPSRRFKVGDSRLRRINLGHRPDWLRNDTVAWPRCPNRPSHNARSRVPRSSLPSRQTFVWTCQVGSGRADGCTMTEYAQDCHPEPASSVRVNLARLRGQRVQSPAARSRGLWFLSGSVRFAGAAAQQVLGAGQHTGQIAAQFQL